MKVKLFGCRDLIYPILIVVAGLLFVVVMTIIRLEADRKQNAAPCSAFKNTPTQYVPPRCLKNFNNHN